MCIFYTSAKIRKAFKVSTGVYRSKKYPDVIAFTPIFAKNL